MRLLQESWNYIDWNALTAIGTLALAIATFATLRRDRELLSIERTPNVIFSVVVLIVRDNEISVDLGEPEKELIIHYNAQNLSRFPILIEKVSLNGVANSKYEINELVKSGESGPKVRENGGLRRWLHSFEKEMELHEFTRSLETHQSELVFYFQYAATQQQYWEIRLPFAEKSIINETSYHFDTDNQTLPKRVNSPKTS